MGKHDRPEIKSKVEVTIVEPEKIVTLLQPGELGAMLDWEVRDSKTGLLMPDPRTGLPNKGTKKSDSFVQQFLQVLFCMMACSGTVFPVPNVRDTTNNLRSITIYLAAGNPLFDVLAAGANSLFGVVVGLDGTAPTISDYHLGTQCAEGAGLNQFNHGGVSFGTPVSDATTSQLTITRSFSNGSANPITVSEIGIYCRCADTGGTIRYFMFIRDTITGSIIVPIGQTLTMSYRPQAVV